MRPAPLFLFAAALALTAACARDATPPASAALKVREAPRCTVASCCGLGGYVYVPLRGCIAANVPPYCGCLCEGDRPYPTKAACEEAAAATR